MAQKEKAERRDSKLPASRPRIKRAPHKSGPSGTTQSSSARRAAGRTQMSVWFDEDDIQRLDLLCKEYALSRTDMMKTALKVAALNMPAPEGWTDE